jgi:hypothetical protein
VQPSSAPSGYPSHQPTMRPSVSPSTQPSRLPSDQPSRVPTTFPSVQPTTIPTKQPTGQPSHVPTGQPSVKPSCQPTMQPSGQPSTMPSGPPTTDSEWILKLQSMINEISGENSLVYHEVVHENLVIDGGCTTWTSFSDEIDSYDEYKKVDLVHSIAAYGVTGLKDPLLSATCAIPSSATSIYHSLQYMKNGSDVSSYKITCSENIWFSKICDTGNVALCVNCWDPCSLSHRESPPMALAFNPCGTKTYRPVSQLRLLKIGYKLPSIVILNMIVTPFRTNITIDIFLSAASTVVYCNAYLAGTTGVNPASIIAANYMELAITRYASISITKLSPLTTYDVYCMAKYSSSSLVKTDDIVVFNKTYVYTQGPLEISVSLAHKAIDISTLPLINFVSFGALENLDIELIVELSLVNVNTSEHCSILPKITNLTSFGLQTSPYLQFCSVAGIYSLIVSTISPRSGIEKYKFVFPLGNTFILLDKSVLETPKMIEAIFSSDLTYVRVYFDSSTNMIGGVSFPCKNILQFSEVGLSICSWASPSVLVVSFSSFSVLAPGDNLTLSNPYELSLRNRDHIVALPQMIVVTPPTFSAVPIVVMSIPSSICSFRDFSINFESSSGSGGRPWKSWAFTVKSLPESVSTSVLESKLNSFEVDSELTVPSDIVVPDIFYILIATMCNYASICGSSSVSFTGVNRIVPIVVIGGGSNARTVSRDKQLQLIVANNVNYDNMNYSYTWQIFENGIENVPLSFSSTSRLNPSIIKIAPYSFLSGRSFGVTLNALDHRSSTVSSSTIFVNVVEAPIVAVIRGSSKISIPKEIRFSLDASESYDLNLPDLTYIDRFSHLNFQWSCVNIFSSLPNQNCNDLIMENINGPLATIIILKSAHNSNVYELSVSVHHDTRSDKASVLLYIGEKDLPLIYVSQFDSSTKVASSSNIQILGSLNWSTSSLPVSEDYEIGWTVDHPLIELSEISLSPTTLKEKTTIVRNFNLVISADTLYQYQIPSGSMTFTLTLDIPNRGKTWAALVVQINAPPTPGKSP